MGDLLKDIRINRIIPYYKSPNDVLIATDGDGVYWLDMKSHHCTRFLQENYQLPNKMNGSIIKDIYIDTAHRIWNVIYPTGLTVYSEQYPAYEWITHSRNNTNSLVDNRINGIMQDSEGDTWFATNNGISCYNPTSKKWRNYLSSFDQNAHNDNHVFISLCELRPGVVMAGGYMSGIYLIYKNTQQVRYISQLSNEEEPLLINTSEAFYATTTVISGLADFIVYVCSIPVMVNATVMIRSTPLHSYLPRMKTLFG